jgi:anti-anti-sigma factor
VSDGQERSWRVSSRQHDLDVSRSEPVDGVTLVTVTGDLDIYTHERLRVLVKDDAAQTPHTVVDLGGVGFLDSTGVGAIVVLHRATQARGADLRLVTAASSILRLLKITGLDQSIAVHASVDDALVAIGEG